MEVLDRNASLFADQMGSTQCDDLQDANLIFREARGGWQLAGVLDWDKAWAGPSGSDIVRMSFWDDMTGAGFWEVYQTVAPPAEGRSERALVYQLPWCLEYTVSNHATSPIPCQYAVGSGSRSKPRQFAPPVRVLLPAADVSFRTRIISRLREGLRWSPAPVVGWGEGSPAESGKPEPLSMSPGGPPWRGRRRPDCPAPFTRRHSRSLGWAVLGSPRRWMPATMIRSRD